MSSTKHHPSSRSGQAEAIAPAPPLDRLSPLLARFQLRASLYHQGPLCGRSHFAAEPGRAFVHVLRQGELRVEHRRGSGAPARLALREPTLLFYPRALDHVFIHPPGTQADFTCATLRFEGGERHPIVAALPALLALPLRAVPGLAPALDLLFAETDTPRCGSALLADRLFEVVMIQLLRWVLDHPEAAGVHSGLLRGLSEPRLAKALVALHQAPGEDWPLSRMAAVAGMSRSAFAEAFKASTGTPPSTYLGDWRLSLAASQLRAGQAQKLVAAELGFSSASALSRAFKQRFGQAPRAWLTQTD